MARAVAASFGVSYSHLTRVLGRWGRFVYITKAEHAALTATGRHVAVLPGTMFMPQGQGQSQIRIAFANVDAAGIAEMFRRLAALRL